MEHIPMFMAIVSIGIFCSLLLMKPLNALLLGAQYAESLGFNTTTNTQLFACCYRVVVCNYHCFLWPDRFYRIGSTTYSTTFINYRESSLTVTIYYS